MSLKDYLGLYQEINVQTHSEANSIKQELYNIQAPSIKVGNDGWVTRCYFWTLGEYRAIWYGSCGTANYIDPIWVGIDKYFSCSANMPNNDWCPNCLSSVYKYSHLNKTHSSAPKRQFRIFKAFMKSFGQWVKIFHHLYQQWMHFQWLLSDVESLVDRDFGPTDPGSPCPNSTPIHLKIIFTRWPLSDSKETWTDSTCIMRSNSNINNRFFQIPFN